MRQLSVICLAILIHSVTAQAVVFTQDPSLFAVKPDSPFAKVGRLGGASGVLIDSQYVATAAHAAYGTPFVLLGESFEIAERWIHPLYDLAVLRLDRDTGLVGYDLYRGDGEAGRTIVVVGWGVSGVGFPDPAQYPRGTCRAALNRIDEVWGSGFAYDFDGPDGCDWSGEGMIAAGDSGGASFLWEDGRYVLAGIHSMVCDGDADGVAPELGDWGVDVRISAAAEWIDSVIVPEPSGLILLSCGWIGLWGRVKP